MVIATKDDNLLTRFIKKFFRNSGHGENNNSYKYIIGNYSQQSICNLLVDSDRKTLLNASVYMMRKHDTQPKTTKKVNLC